MTQLPTEPLSITVVGAGGKMGMRVSDNLQCSDHDLRYAETSPRGRERVAAAGRTVSESADAVAGADVVILAVPDIALGPVSATLVPLLRPGTIVLTLDPAAAYANLLERRDDLESGDPAVQAVAEEVIRLMYAPVLDVHWVTVKQLAYLEPTLVEVVACMVGDLLNEALRETVDKVGVPEPAARAILLGHVQVALANGLRGDNPFSDACLIAMDYGRQKVIKDDWRSIFDDAELDHVLKQMLHLDHISR